MPGHLRTLRPDHSTRPPCRHAARDPSRHVVEDPCRPRSHRVRGPRESRGTNDRSRMKERTMRDLGTEPPTERTRRIGQGLALILAPWAFVIANSGDILTTEHSVDDTTPRGALLISAAHPLADRWFTFIAMIGCMLILPAALGAMGLVRVKAARLGLLGGVLMITGYICYFAMLFQGYATIALAQHGAANTDNVAVQDLMMNQGFFIVVALTFVARQPGRHLPARPGPVPGSRRTQVGGHPGAGLAGGAHPRGPLGRGDRRRGRGRRIGRGGPDRASGRRSSPRTSETHGHGTQLPQRRSPFC